MWSNKFESLLDEEEDADSPPVVVKTKQPAVVKPAAKLAKDDPKPAPRKPEAVDNKDPRISEARPEHRSVKEPRKDRSEEGGDGTSSPDRPPRPRGDRPPNRERRTDREGGAVGSPRARTFDRHSGTGRGREDKRGGAGRGNWGHAVNDQKVQDIPEKPEIPEEDANWNKPVDEVAPEPVAQVAASHEPDVATTSPPQPAPPPASERTETPEEIAQRAEREKEQKMMTLDEYLSTLKTPSSVPRLDLRKAGEGEDPRQWAKFIAAPSKQTSAEKTENKSSNSSKVEKPKSKESNKAPVELLGFKSSEPRRERPPRDAVRPPRDASAGGPREHRQQQQQQRAPFAAAVPVVHAVHSPSFGLNDFPALKA